MTTVLTPDIARQLAGPLRQVCTQIGTDPHAAQLIKYTMNAVFVTGPYVVRLARGAVAAGRAETVCAASAALVAADVPFIRPAVDRPIHAGDWVATVWHYVETVDVAAEPVDLVLPLNAIHRLAAPVSGLPLWDPITKFQKRIREARHLPESDQSGLDSWSRTEIGMPAERVLDLFDQWCLEAEADLAEVDWAFPAGPIHGDAHTGNLLLRSVPVRPGPDPTALICDPDGLCRGQREWDYSATAHGVTRFGRDRAAYDRFADGVGFDVTSWSGWPTIVRVRELQLVTSTIATITGRPGVATQLALRVRSLLAGDESVVWSRHR
jgi:Phosphotransferase enzyme family